MNMQNNDKWLDELISQNINTTKPQFDAEEWKTRHPDALQSIRSRRTIRTGFRQPDTLRRIFAHPIAGLATAAAVIVVVSSLWLTRDKPTPNSANPEPTIIAQSPAKIVSMMSLRMAYQTGGWDALDRQFQETLETFGPGPSSISVQQLLEGPNGS
jgi:hypothetical protein